MPHVTFIYPCIGRFPDTRYVRSWQMQPLAIAVLSALTPPSWGRSFFDDRLEEVEFDRPTDLVAISMETYTARRGYQIADEYRRRGVPVVMGGYHATFMPDEVLEHADAVCIGEAESIWGDILTDAEGGSLSGRYESPELADLTETRLDRSIFDGKDYFKLALVETSRGCRFNCSFCSITSFFGARHRRRPVEDIVAEIEALDEDAVFFVDDNIVGDPASAKEFFRALVPLGIRWISQASVNIASDEELLDLMAASGCKGLLIGFESMNSENLFSVGKTVNVDADYAGLLSRLRSRGIVVYGTFLLGLDEDGPDSYREDLRFAVEQKLFMAAFNHVVPFPGTPLYDQFEAEGRLIHDRWWLSEDFRFGQSPFRPTGMGPSDLEMSCHRARVKFYALPSVLRRGTDLSANCRDVTMAKLFFGINLLMRKEVSMKRGLPLGVRDQVEEG
jgi:radical SAM superfamily enzyme YgiQ (UPF0313 family)